MRNNKGITLIALVITIIIMIILAAVAIAALTGDNGLITNTQEARTYNAYSSAREQMTLSFMTVRTEIEFQVAKDSTYNATEDNNESALLAKLTEDYKDSDSKFTFYLDHKASVIYMLYSDSAIDAGVITEGTEPVHDYYVLGYIKLDEQSCTFTFDDVSVAITDADNDGHASLDDYFTPVTGETTGNDSTKVTISLFEKYPAATYTTITSD